MSTSGKIITAGKKTCGILMHSHASCEGRVPSPSSKGHQSTNRNVLVKLVLLLNMLNVDHL